MDELAKFEKAADHLIQVMERLDPDDPDPYAVQLALAEAKRVRRESTLLTRVLAKMRDELQP
jgi:hypothetical protein